MPVVLPPAPQPGDLITADLINRIADAARDLDLRLESLTRRVALLEQGGGRLIPQLVPLDENKYKLFVEKLRTDRKILDEPDTNKRLELAADLWLQERQDIVLDAGIRRTNELTEGEWVLLGAAAAIKPSDVASTLEVTRPTSAQAIRTQFGKIAPDLDAFANLNSGFIGIRP